MQRLMRVGLYAGAVTLLVGCASEGALGPSSFQARYDTARTALEQGRYPRAIAGYQQLLKQAGPLQDRLRLELAHSYLRDGQFDAASRTSRALAQGLSGQDRAAVLAVQGVADHERGLAALGTGDRVQGAALLRQADSAMQTVVVEHPDLDPLGALAARRASIEVRLRSL